MLINTHCHIFNLQSVFTDETKDILRTRLDSTSMSSGFKKFLLGLLDAIMAGKEKGLDPDDPKRIKHLKRQFDPAKDMSTSGLGDYWQFLAIALADSMDQVTDHLLSRMGPEDIIAPMMMDITNGTGSDTELFDRQIENTLKQCLRRPGRVLPFYAFNPIRPDALARLEKVVKHGVFVGMKLYPSLGYRINLKGGTHMALDKIELANKKPGVNKPNHILEALRICNDNAFPVMQHSSQGGFYAHANYIDYGHPRHWRDILYPGGKGPYLDKLKVCFAHMGGSGKEIAACLPPDKGEKTWIKATLRMIDGSWAGQAPNPNIFTDVADVTDVEPWREFFKIMITLLNNKAYGRQILWGTDYFLVELTASNELFTEMYMEHLKGELKDRLILGNPQRFLGLDLGDPAASEPNIRKHVKYLWNHKAELNLDVAAKWVKPILQADALPAAFDI